MHPARQSTVSLVGSSLAWGTLSERVGEGEDPLRTAMADLVLALDRPSSGTSQI